MTDQARVNTRRKALVDLSDIFRDIEDPAKLAGAANRLLGQALQVSRVGYGTIDHDTETLLREQEWNAPGIKALPERVFLRQFGSFVDELKCGAPNVISDARLDARTVSAAGELEALAGMSFINVPVIESGRLVALLYVNNAEPRFWPQEDLDLIQEFALRLRIAVERSKSAGALRLSEATAQENLQRVQLALSAGAIIGTWHWDLVNDQFTVDEAFATAFGLDPLLGHKGIPFAQIVATVHPDDQAGLATAIKDAVARCGTYAHQYRTRRADGNYYWLEANGRVDCGLDGKPKSFPGVLLDMEERRANEAERARVAKLLQDSEQFLRSVLASSNDCIKVLNLDANLVFMSEGGQRVMEVSDFNAVVGCPWPDFWQDEGNAAASDAVAAAKAGTASNFQGYAETLRGNRRYWDVQVSPIVGTDGRPERILSVSRDITALKEAEEVRAVLNQELSHRMKNTLAMVQAIATQTLRQATSIEEGRKALSLRLGALARAQDILTRADFTEADTQAVVSAAIGPHQTKDDRIRVRGEAFPLTSEQALGLSLAIHELATNAVKYGALSDGCGTVDVKWARRNGAFHFTWIESGGPAVNPPSKRGFGSTLIERIVASYFGGEAHIAFDASGVQFELNGVEDAAFQE